MQKKYVLVPLFVACSLYLLPSLISSTSTTLVSVFDACIWPRSSEFWNSVKHSPTDLSAMRRAPQITPSIMLGFSDWTRSEIRMSSHAVSMVLSCKKLANMVLCEYFMFISRRIRHKSTSRFWGMSTFWDLRIPKSCFFRIMLGCIWSNLKHNWFFPKFARKELQFLNWNLCFGPLYLSHSSLNRIWDSHRKSILCTDHKFDILSFSIDLQYYVRGIYNYIRYYITFSSLCVDSFYNTWITQVL